jgi:competence protein ComEC
MVKSRIFLILSLSFLFGIFWQSFFSGFYQILIYIFLVSAVIAAAVFYSRRSKIILIIFFSLSFFFFGFRSVGNKLSEINDIKNEKEISETAIVAKEPVAKEKYLNVIVKTKNNLKVLLTAGLYSDLQYGDELNLKCNLKIPQNKDSSFDYRMYLAKDGIFYICDKPSFEKTGKNKGNIIYATVINFKNRLADNISRTIPEPEGALAIGLIFGGTSGLSKEESNNFSKTGLSHIVAVSGFNVTIVAEYLMYAGIFIGLWRKQAFWFAVVGIFLFVFMVGFPSSAVRAGIMGSLLIWAMKNGRLANSQNAIIFSAAVMLLLNPLLLRYDVGFQLSFLATLGIIQLSPFWEKYFLKKARAFVLAENVFLTLSATIFVLPIIIYNFNIVSFVSLLANFLVLSIVPLAMLLVFLTAVAGLIFPPLSIPFAWVTFLPLKYIIEIVNYLANLSWSSMELKNFGVWHLLAWYVALFLAIFFIKSRMRKNFYA